MVSHQDQYSINDDDGSPVGINALSPSTDAIFRSSTRSFFSPIGSPVVSHMPSELFQVKNVDVPLGKSDASFEPTRERLTYENVFLKDFNNLSMNQQSLTERNVFTSSPSDIMPYPTKKPNPLIKQNSLPPLFKIGSSSSDSLSPRYNKSNHYHPLLGIKHKSEESIFDGPNISKPDVSDDEWLDHFGMELEQNYDLFDKGGRHSYNDPPSKISYTEVHQQSNSVKLPIPSLKMEYPRKGSLNLEQYNNHSNNTSPRSNFTFGGNIKHSSRVISVQNAYMFDDNKIASQFDIYEVRSIRKLDNVLLVSFFDVREALKAMQNLAGTILDGITIELSFYLLRDFTCPEDYNQGTLVIFNLDSSVDNADLKRIFGEYGKIREIRESPNKKHKFVEFYDVRDAENAMNKLNKSEINGRRIKIEPSRPGGSNKHENSPREYLNKSISTSVPTRLSFTSNFVQESDSFKKSTLSPRFDNVSKNDFVHKEHSNYWNDSSINKEDFQTKSYNHSNFSSFVESPEVSKYELNLKIIRENEDIRTTLMIKNIPNKYDQDMLLMAINSKHIGSYDFFYLPIDFKNRCNVGYAFINFIDPLSIPPFFEEFNNKKWEKFNSEKVCQIRYARIQGKDAMVEHFKNSSVMNEDPKCRPLIFQSDGMGKPQPFPLGANVKARRKKK